MVRKDKSKIYTILVVLLVIIEISSLFLLNKSAMNKPVILDDVVKEPIKKEKAFAILIQSGNNYIPSNTFPDSNEYVYDNVKSGCIDETGQRILINGENVITYDAVNQLAELSTPSTSYCYLYFNLID